MNRLLKASLIKFYVNKVCTLNKNDAQVSVYQFIKVNLAVTSGQVNGPYKLFLQETLTPTRFWETIPGGIKSSLGIVCYKVPVTTLYQSGWVGKRSDR